MNANLLVLMIEAMAVYLLVLWAHSLRGRAGLGPFYALLGGITAVMSWVTDAGVVVRAGGITFMVGSTVFYTALLLGVFVVYVFDGPPATRVAILTVAGVSAMVPVIAAVLHVQMRLLDAAPLGYVPLPSLRINAASVAATAADLVFLAVAWEFLGHPKFRMPAWTRAFLTLLGVMWLDVLLFATGAFAGTPGYLGIMGGTLISRLFIALFAFPFLYAYLEWQSRETGFAMVPRPILAILKQVVRARPEPDPAQQEVAARLRMDEALIESKERYRAFLDATDDLVFIKDEDSRYLFANPAATRFCGRPLSDLLGCRDEDLMPAGAAARCRETDRRALASGGVVVSVEPVADRVYETRKFALPLKSGGVGVGAIIRDITENRKTEENLRFQAQLLAGVGESVVATDLEGRILYWGPGAERLYGYAAAEVMGRPYRQFAGPLEPPEEEIFRRELLAKGAWRGEYVQKKRDGTLFRSATAVSLVTDGNGRPAGFIGIDRDLTEPRASEQALRTSEAQLSNALQIARAGHWEYDVASDTFTFNDHFYRIFRTTAAAVGGYAMRSADYARRFCHPDDAALVAREIEAAIRTADPNSSRQIEHRILYADGQVGYIAVRFFIVKDDQGRTVRTYGVNQDITERKQAEILLREQMEELRHWNKITLGREQRILELKHEVNTLLARAGKPAKYDSAETE